MSDPTNPFASERQGTGTTGSGTRSSTGSTSASAGETLREGARQVRDAASSAAEQAKSAAEQAKHEATGLLDTAKERAAGVAEEGRRAGAEQAQGIARAVHRAADELDRDSPTVARMLHDAAGSIDGMARALREQSPGEMMRGAEQWARRQPYVFFGVAALAGFALARFARSSASQAGSYRTQGYGGGSQGMGHGRVGAMPGAPSAGHEVGGATGAPGWVADESGTPRPATMAAASLGGAAAQRPSGTTGGTGGVAGGPGSTG
ncbi:hypothetical protein [Falsiroseomonas sp. HW251]|uniref:hypothetical protein n=1 Tax=Falsiroseomonas sp. HW251 TaxID=3390998 RepID=UPI003D317088